MANLINLEKVSKAYGIRPLLSEVSLGISVGERIGIVGRNGDGKTTLLEVMTGLEEPDAGRVSMNRGVEIGYLHQGDELVDTHSVREAVLGGRADHEWLADSTMRGVVTELLAGVSLDRPVLGLSGGERQSLAIARAVHFGARVLILDEPTAALGVKQASHVLRIVNEAKRRGLAVIFITHQVMHAMAVGDHFAVLIRGAIAADFRKGEKTREEITDLMAGGEHMAELEAEIGTLQARA